MDAALQSLAQVQDLRVAGKDLGENDENIPDVGVISCLQAVNRSLDVVATEDTGKDKDRGFLLTLSGQKCKEQQQR